MPVPYADTYASTYHGPVNYNSNFDKSEDLIVLCDYIPDLGFNVFAAIAWGLVMVLHL